MTGLGARRRFAVGLATVLLTAMSVFTTLVIPRTTSSRLLRSVSRFLAKAVKPILRRLDTYEAKDRVMGHGGAARHDRALRGVAGPAPRRFGLMVWWVSGGTLTSSLGVSGSVDSSRSGY